MKEIMMIDDDYIYKLDERFKESMGLDDTYPEFAEEAARIITEYARKYKPIAVPDMMTELRIRGFLAYEHMLKRKFPPEHRDYWIKVYMLMVDRDYEYEDSIAEDSLNSIQ